jgi:hypothetical protein
MAKRFTLASITPPAILLMHGLVQRLRRFFRTAKQAPQRTRNPSASFCFKFVANDLILARNAQPTEIELIFSLVA